MCTKNVNTFDLFLNNKQNIKNCTYKILYLIYGMNGSMDTSDLWFGSFGLQLADFMSSLNIPSGKTKWGIKYVC